MLIAINTPEGAQGDAKAFLMRLGAVSCLDRSKQTRSVQLVFTETKYTDINGHRNQRVIGVQVSERVLVKRTKEHINKRTGEITDVEFDGVIKKTFGFHVTRPNEWKVTYGG